MQVKNWVLYYQDTVKIYDCASLGGVRLALVQTSLLVVQLEELQPFIIQQARTVCTTTFCCVDSGDEFQALATLTSPSDAYALDLE